MSGEIDGHCPTLHHPFIVSLNVFTTLFLPHLHFASLDMAITETARDIHFLELMHFIWSAKPPQLTSCHSGLPYDITPLAPAVPPRPPPRPHPLPPPSLRCLKQLQCPTVTGCSVIVFCRVLSAPVVLSVFHVPIFLLKNGSFWGLFFTTAGAEAQWWAIFGAGRAQSAQPRCEAPANQGTRGVLEGLMAFWCS